MAKNLKSVVKEAADKESPQPIQQELDAGVALHRKIANQIEEEYNLAWKFMRPKIEEWYIRLRILNNQKRNKDKVGDNTMFTIMNTLMSALYSDDEFLATFEAREEGDQLRAENLNAVAKYDVTPMQKDILDYEWDWDTLFFGRAPLLLNDFDRLTKTPMPEVLDPLTFLRYVLHQYPGLGAQHVDAVCLL